jgi:hypothetical protein
MNTNDFLSQQPKQLQIRSLITLVLVLISFLGLFYNIYAYHEIKAKAPAVEAIRNGIGLGIIPKLMLYLSITILFLSALNHNLKFKLLGILTTILGIVSFLWILFDFAALQDISHEYLTGKFACLPEWKVLYYGLFINFIFLFIGLFTILKIRREAKSLVKNRKSIIEESTFEIIQYIGIVCSLIGIAFVLFIYSVFSNNNLIISDFTVFLIVLSCLIIFLPYILVIIYWIHKLTREEDRSLIDEKQKQDLTRSGLVAFLFSILFISVFFMINHGRIGQISAIVYLPFYLFATLLIFSISVLYNFKKS